MHGDRCRRHHDDFESLRGPMTGWGPPAGGPRGRGRGRGFGPFDAPMPPPFRGGRGMRARKGDVRGAILSLLAERPSNGYGLIKAIAEKSGGVWKASPGSVYPTLQQLTDEGLIAPTAAGDARTEYALTDAGREYVDAHGEDIARAWRPSSRAWEEHGELMAATGKLMGVLRQVQDVGTPQQREQAVAKLDELRRELYRMLGE